MKHAVVLGFFLVILTSLQAQRVGGKKNRAPLTIQGEQLPDLTAHDETGKPFSLNQRLKGKHGVIVFGCLT